jgi:hypothetical protein
MPALSLDFRAGWVPLACEPGDTVAPAITVPTEFAAGTWKAYIWRDDRKTTLLATASVSVGAQLAENVPQGRLPRRTPGARGDERHRGDHRHDLERHAHHHLDGRRGWGRVDDGLGDPRRARPG